MRNAFLFVAATLAVWSPSELPVLGKSTAHAQEIQITGPLAGAPACRRCRIYREGRIQLQPFVAFTLTDEFTRTIPVGLQANYHFTDWLGAGIWGAWGGGLSLDTGLTDQVSTQGQTNSRNRLSLPSAEGFPDQIGQLQWFAAAQLTFIPLRGKLALFQKLFIDADFYITAGVAFIGVEERAEVTDGSVCDTPGPACLDTQQQRESRVAIAPTFAVGLMLMATDFFGISFEWRALPFAWNTSGTDEAGTGPGNDFPDGQIDGDDQIFRLNHMVSIGFAFYLPPEAPISD